MRERFGRSLWGVAFALTMLLSASAAVAKGKKDKPFRLTILHNNDAESQLLNAGSGIEDFGGAARFVSKVNQLRLKAWLRGDKVLMLSSGDNFLAGPEFNASLEKGVPFYDSILVSFIGYNCLAIGNHEFDFGPDVLADFVQGICGRAKFVTANLDFGLEPRLAALVDRRDIVKSRVVRLGREEVGIVGATTENLSFISRPRGTSPVSTPARRRGGRAWTTRSGP